MKNVTDYRNILKSEFEKRVKLNSRYSLRAFARDLDMNPARLSHVLKGSYGLSVDAAEKMAFKLGMSEQQKNIFCNMIALQHARSLASKKKASENLKKSTYFYDDIETDEFKVIADWYHFPIIELTMTQDFTSTPRWIAQKLGITEMEAKLAVERLVKVGLLKYDVDGELIPSSRFYVNQKGTPDASIRSYHKQILNKAIEAVDFQDTEIRDFGTLTIAINEEDIPLVKQRLKELRNQLDLELSKKDNRNYVYTLSTQFFCMQNDKPKVNKELNKQNNKNKLNKGKNHETHK